MINKKKSRLSPFFSPHEVSFSIIVMFTTTTTFVDVSEAASQCNFLTVLSFPDYFGRGMSCGSTH